MHDRSQSWFGTDISIKRGGVKLILLDTTSPFTKMMRSTCEQVHLEWLSAGRRQRPNEENKEGVT